MVYLRFFCTFNLYYLRQKTTCYFKVHALNCMIAESAAFHTGFFFSVISNLNTIVKLTLTTMELKKVFKKRYIYKHASTAFIYSLKIHNVNALIKCCGKFRRNIKTKYLGGFSL